MEKARVIIFKFEAEEVTQTDITRFKNLLKKLKVRVEFINNLAELKGKTANLVVIDEEW